jgi:hypothetical protein
VDAGAGDRRVHLEQFDRHNRPAPAATNSLFDPLNAGGARAYRVLEYVTYFTTNVVNGGFETGTGTNAANWTSSGSEPPYRVSTNSHSGAWSMLLANDNKATGGIQFQQDEQIQGAPAIVPGLSYTFSFWAQQLLNGVGYVQQYKLSWLNSADAVISSSNANFTWRQRLLGSNHCARPGRAGQRRRCPDQFQQYHRGQPPAPPARC